MKPTLTLLLNFLVAFCASQNLPSYKIVYNVGVPVDSVTTNYEVFVMDMNGENKTNITNNPDVAWAYYAYKNRLFFISDRDTCYRCYYLYETGASGNNPKKISTLQLEDSWMGSRNNGKELVVSGRIGKSIRAQLFIIDTDTGAFSQITNDTLAMHRDPTFSPDGKHIVFAYKKNRKDRNSHEELYSMDADGKNLKQLTFYPKNDPFLKDFGYKAGPPKWHPTKNFISYQSQQNGKYSLYAVTPDGSKHWKLTENPQEEGWHDWSPDGRWLAIEFYDDKTKQFSIALMDWETKEVKLLTDDNIRLQHAPVFVTDQN